MPLEVTMRRGDEAMLHLKIKSRPANEPEHDGR
jgi:hypothetical protein